MRKSIVVSRSSLPLRRLVAPDDLGRPQLRRRLLGAHAGIRRAEQVLEEVLVALARGAEQVRPPDGQHAREVLRRVGVLAGEAQPALAQLARRRARPGRARPARPRRRGRAGCGRSSGYDGSQPSRAPSALQVGDVRARRRGRARAARRARSGPMRLVAPLVGREVEERRAGLMARRPHPVERERERSASRSAAAPSPGRRSGPSRRR